MISSLLERAKNVNNSNVESWLRWSNLKRWATNWLSVRWCLLYLVYTTPYRKDLFFKDLVSRKES
jgi:hypothetical protein